MLKGLARNIVKAKGEVQWSDKKAFDTAVNKEKAKLARRFASKELNPFLLKRVEVRVVGTLESCSAGSHLRRVWMYCQPDFSGRGRGRYPPCKQHERDRAQV